MRLLILALLCGACARDAMDSPDAGCVPGASPASYLTGSWSGVPEHPSDFGIYLDLAGSPAAICGVATHWAGGADAGFPTAVAGSEQALDVDQVNYAVIPRDANHFALGRDAGAELEFTRR